MRASCCVPIRRSVSRTGDCRCVDMFSSCRLPMTAVALPRPPVSSGDSGISGLTITPEGSQLLLNWTSTLNADFESLRAQVWVRVGDEDVFLPGCLGGEVHDVSTVEVFCMLSHGQSGDVYHAAVGFIRGDRTAAPVETAQWTRP